MLRSAVACVLIAVLGIPVQSVASQARAKAARGADRPVWPDEGPATWRPRPTVPAITANDLRTRLYQFADDSMLGRKIGEPGNYTGTAYIAREFARLGLTPAGEGGTFFQELPFGTLTLDSAAIALSVTGAPLTPRTDWLPIAPAASNSMSARAALTDVPTVFAGSWGDSTTLDAALVRGKVAVFLATPAAAGLVAGRGTPGPLQRCDSVPDRFGAAAAAQVEAAQRSAGGAAGAPRRAGAARDTRAERAGAVGILLVALDSAPLQAVSAAFAPRAMMALADSSRLPAAVVSSATAARIFDRSLQLLLPGAPGQRISGRWVYTFRRPSTPGRNVIAILRGTDPARANEYVMVSAHNDHVGLSATAVDHDSLRAVNTVTRRQGANDPACRPTDAQQHAIDSLIARARSIRAPRRDSIMNGADDDGSGTVVLLEIAERFATEKPARSILFVSHEGEEGGLLGSEWFTDHPTVPLASIVAAHNMDMVGKGRVDQVKFGGPASIQSLGSRRLSREFGDIIDSVNAVRVETMAIDRSWDVTANPMNRFCRSDQVNYVHHGVPVTYFSLGYAEDYHQPTDEPRYVDYEHAARVGRFIHDVMLAIADRKDRPAIAGPDPAYPLCR